MQRRALALALVVSATAAIACGDDSGPTVTPVSKIVTFKATLNGAAEVPAVNSPGSGTFTATLDTSTNVFTYDVTFTGLSSNVNNGHIHGPSGPTTTSGAILNFNTLAGATFSFGATTGTARGTITLNAATAVTATVNGDSLKKLLFAGLTYANIHTINHGGGEIRGQITKQ